MRISDWSSDVCSSDLRATQFSEAAFLGAAERQAGIAFAHVDVVDRYATDLQRGGDAPRTCPVRAEYARAEAIFTVVGKPDRVGFVGQAHHRKYRAEGLCRPHPHVRRGLIDDHRLNKQ